MCVCVNHKYFTPLHIQAEKKKKSSLKIKTGGKNGLTSPITIKTCDFLNYLFLNLAIISSNSLIHSTL